MTQNNIVCKKCGKKDIIIIMESYGWLCADCFFKISENSFFKKDRIKNSVL
jgi:NMD protein affecting ribosome stability and mRNA decay